MDPLNNKFNLSLNDWWMEQTATYAYDEGGRLVSLTNFNGTKTIYDYDDSNRLTSLSNNSATIISSHRFTLDGNGNRVREDRSGPVKAAGAPASLAATYEKNRLRTAGPLSYARRKRKKGEKGTHLYFMLDMVPMIAAIYVNLDLLKNADTLQGWLTAVLDIFPTDKRPVYLRCGLEIPASHLQISHHLQGHCQNELRR